MRRRPYARAVGEIGLDYHYDFSPREVQQAVFRAQVRLALELRLPVVIHTREAEADTIEH
jgi:TatD DNase family protein